MGYREIFLSLLVIGVSSGQIYKVCVPSSDPVTCQNLERGDSAVSCTPVDNRLDCALKISRGEADFGAFTEEETMLLAQMSIVDRRVVATIRAQDKTAVPYAFEAVAVVPNAHTGGLEGLRGGSYCHPGMDTPDLRWSPRVLKSLEQAVTLSGRCPDIQDKTVEEVEVESLSNFFSRGCRPGPWSYNTTVDADLKRRFPNLCSLCSNAACSGYNVSTTVGVTGVSNNNRHIQALDCLISGGTVAYVAWQHVQEFFMIRNPQNANQYSLLCPDSSLVTLTTEVLGQPISPCAIVRQPWRTIVANTANAAAVRTQLSTWWPNGVDPGTGSWQSTLYQTIVGSTSFRVVIEELATPLNYTSSIRPIDNIDKASSCFPATQWCSVSSGESVKCSWLAASSYVLGIEPRISCATRGNVFVCLDNIKKGRSDVVTVDSNYGYLARQNYQLSPVKLVQNARSAASRVAAFVKETTAQSNVTRFENLRDKVACFPEFGGIAYVAFVRTAHERNIISSSECDYARAVGEYFSGACAPGAMDTTHSLSDSSSFNSSVLCSACRVSSGDSSAFTCAWDYTNQYFGNNGSLACLADPATDVAFLETQDLAGQMAALNLRQENYRALCRNNTLAVTTGINIDDGCLMAHLVDAEVLSRRVDPNKRALNTLFDALDRFFGYNIAQSEQLINLHMYSAFDGMNDLLFKDSTIGLTEPSVTSTHEPAKNYIELFQHLEACTGAASPGPVSDMASRAALSIMTLLIMFFLSSLL